MNNELDTLIDDILHQGRCWRKYKPSYGLKMNQTRPTQHPSLSSMVMTARQLYPGSSVIDSYYVSFSEEFVQMVGKVLPFGVSPEMPAMLLHITVGGRSGFWMVAAYLDMSHPRTLWREKAPWWE